MKQYISDVISHDYLKWNTGEMVCIHAGTGTGKSHFIRNELYEHAKAYGHRILFISNRDKLKAQNKLYIKGKEDTITIINYQAIEAAVLRGEQFNFDLFQYVVADECHYWLTDSNYNRDNDLSLKAILNANNCIRIFMTATGNSFFSFIQSEYKNKLNIWKYNVHNRYSSIKQLYFFNKDESLEQFITKQIKPEEKVLYFCNNVEKIYKLSTQYKDSLFIFSDPYRVDESGQLIKKSPHKNNNDKFAHYLDRESIQRIIETNKLNKQFTFTTTTLDNGIDIFDNTLKYIVCDNIRDFDIMIQCIGRKRFIDEYDKVSVIIRNVNNMALGGMLKRISDTLNEVNVFLESGVKAWIECCNRYSNSDYCIYDTPDLKNKYGSNKKVNRAKYEKVKADYNLLRGILREDKDIREREEMSTRKGQHIAFIRYVCSLLHKDRYILIDDTFGRNTMDDYLESLVGINLYKEQQEELSLKMNIRHDGKLMKSRDVFNSSFEEIGLDYTIKPSKKDTRRVLDDGSKNPNYQRSYWIICKLTDKKIYNDSKTSETLI